MKLQHFAAVEEIKQKSLSEQKGISQNASHKCLDWKKTLE